jgi:ATP-dependent Clp protease adaptor protein ClpS
MNDKLFTPDIDENIPLPPKVKEILEEKEVQTDIPRFHVVLFDDADHTYDYVIEMLMDLFGYGNSVAFQMACEVDILGKVIVHTSNREHAEYKRDQIINYGPDWRLDHSKSSMRATIIPAKSDITTQ